MGNCLYAFNLDFSPWPQYSRYNLCKCSHGSCKIRQKKCWQRICIPVPYVSEAMVRHINISTMCWRSSMQVPNTLSPLKPDWWYHPTPGWEASCTSRWESPAPPDPPVHWSYIQLLHKRYEPSTKKITLHVLTLHLFYIYALQKQIFAHTHKYTIIVNQTAKTRLYKETNYDKLKTNNPERI